MGFMINDDRFLLGCLDHWEFGVDNTGNLLDLKNMEKIKVSVPNNKFSLFQTKYKEL